MPLTLDPIPGLRSALRLHTHDADRDLVSAKLHEQRCWEPYESRLLLACLSPDSVVLDVGANIGYFSLLFALAERPPARILAFEPAADNFALLSANLSLNACDERVTALRVALSEVNGATRLHRSSDNFGDHQLYAGDGPRHSEPVQQCCGDEALADLGVDRVDLVKVDTQGTETAVLRGLLPVLQRSAGSLQLLVELTPWSLRAAGSSGRELITLLQELGLPLAIVDHVEGRLVPESAPALCRWSDNVDACAGDRGFMNIFAGALPPGFH